MNNILKNLILGLIFVSIISLVTAAVVPEKTSASLESGRSVSISVEISNDSSQNVEAQLIARTSSNDIKAEFAQTTIFLNANQKTRINLLISSSVDAEGTYSVEALMRTPAREERANIQVNVFKDSTQRIVLIAFPANVCRDKTQTVSIKVENNTSRFQSISLSAESELFLPTIEPAFIELGPGESEFVEMQIHSNNSFRPGNYSINVFAQTSTQIVQSSVRINLVNCVPEQEELFSLKVSSTCKEIQKDKTSFVPFTLTNLTNENQEIRIGVISDIINSVNQKNIFLEPKEQKSFEIELQADTLTETGRHTVSIFAFNQEFSVTQNACVIVQPLRLTKVELIKNNLDIERGSSETFEIKLSNSGDQSEKFFIRTGNIGKDFTVNRSTESIIVPKKETRTVFINVFASVNAGLGEHILPVIVQADKTREITLNFEVKPEIKRIEEELVRLVSFPSSIELMQGESKNITFTLVNDSGKDLDNLRIRSEGFPTTISSNTISVDSLAMGERKTVSMQITAEDNALPNNYNGFISIENDSFKQKVALTIKVTGEENEAVTGLIALGKNLGLALLAIIFVLVLLIMLDSGTQKRIPRRHFY